MPTLVTLTRHVDFINYGYSPASKLQTSSHNDGEAKEDQPPVLQHRKSLSHADVRMESVKVDEVDVSKLQDANAAAANRDSTLTRSAVVESAHPYLQAEVRSWRMNFPETTNWIVVEIDSRSATSQPEDK